MHDNSTSRENQLEDFSIKTLEFETTSFVPTESSSSPTLNILNTEEIENEEDKNSPSVMPTDLDDPSSLAEIFVTPMVGTTENPEIVESAEEVAAAKDFYNSKVEESLETNTNITLKLEELMMADVETKEYQEKPTMPVEKTQLQLYMDNHPNISYLLDIKQLVDTMFVPPLYVKRNVTSHPDLITFFRKNKESLYYQCPSNPHPYSFCQKHYLFSWDSESRMFSAYQEQERIPFLLF